MSSSLMAKSTAQQQPARHSKSNNASKQRAADDTNKHTDAIRAALTKVCCDPDYDPDLASKLVVDSDNAEATAAATATFLAGGVATDEEILSVVTVLSGVNLKTNVALGLEIRRQILLTITRAANDCLTKNLANVIGQLYQIGYYGAQADVYEDLLGVVSSLAIVAPTLRNTLKQIITTATEFKKVASVYEVKLMEQLDDQASSNTNVGCANITSSNTNNNFLSAPMSNLRGVSFQSDCSTQQGLSNVPSNGNYDPLSENQRSGDFSKWQGSIGQSSSSFELPVPEALRGSSASFDIGNTSSSNTMSGVIGSPNSNTNSPSLTPSNKRGTPKKSSSSASSAVASPKHSSNSSNTVTETTGDTTSDVRDRNASKTLTPAQLDELKSRTVYLNRLDPSVTEGELRDMLLGCGAFMKVRLCGDVVGRTRYGFVEFVAPDAARRLIAMDRLTLGSYSMRCLPAKSAILDVDAKRDAVMDPKKGMMRGCLFGLNL